MRWIALTLSLVFVGFSTSSVVADGSGTCYDLVAFGSCQSWLGDRVSDFGCSGCTVQNGQSHCVGYASAARSLAEPFWSQVVGSATPTFSSGYYVTSSRRVCATWFNCYPLCYFDEALGRDNCYFQSNLDVWDFFFDYATQNCWLV
jgi:hypothetical protein